MAHAWERTGRMKVVVTGAAGFIGSHLCEALVARGLHVVGIDGFTDNYARSVKEANVAGLRAGERFSFQQLDLRDGDLGPACDGADAVFHLAALPGLQDWSHFGTYLGCNLAATQRVLEAARRAGVHQVLHASTSSVYGLEARSAEDAPVAPCSAYGVTKVGAEELCRSYARVFGVPITILRFFSVYGPRQRPDMAYNIFTKALLEGRPISVHGDGEQSRSNTFIDDVVQGAILAYEHRAASVGETFNLGGGEVVTVNRALELLSEITGCTAEIRHTGSRPGDQRHTQADCAKAERLLGYRATTRLVDGLRAQVAWHREALATAE